MKINADAGARGYRNKGTQSNTGMFRYRIEMGGCRNTNAGGISFDADAQLRIIQCTRKQFTKITLVYGKVL
jgi:hypothetical protein